MSYSFNNLTLNNLDSTGTLNIGSNTATAIIFGKTGVTTTFPGPISSTVPISFNDIDATAGVMQIGKAVATKVEIGKSAITTEIKGKLIIKDNIDTAGTLTIGGTASALTITPNTTVAGTLTVQTPSSNSHAATKAYVDSVASGLDVKASVDLKTTGVLPGTYAQGTLGLGATITAPGNGILTVDAVLTTAGMRILVTENGLSNGIYTVDIVGTASLPYVLTRSLDTDTKEDVSKGLFTYVISGTVAGNGYVLTNDIITMGTTPWTFSQLSSISSFNQSNITGTGIINSGSTTGAFGPLVVQNLSTPPANTEGGLYYDTDDKKISYYNGTVWGELGGGSGGSGGIYANFIVKQVGSAPSSAISVYCTKVKNNITLSFPSFIVPSVIANTNSFISNDITPSELQPTFPCIFPVVINDKPAYVKFVNNNLEFIKLENASWDTGNNTVQGFTISYNANSSTVSNGTWGTVFPSSTVTMSKSPTTTLKKNETATITFTFSGDPGSTFILADVTGTGAGSLSNLIGSGTSRSATFTPTDSNNITTYTLNIAADVFTATYSNIAATQLSIDADTRLPSITTRSPNSFSTADNANLVIVFDETVVINTGNVVIYKDGVSWKTIPIGDAQITLSQTTNPNDTLTINQTTDMDDNANYYVLIDSGALKDVSNNLFTGITSTTEWTFSTSDGATALVELTSAGKTLGSVTSWAGTGITLDAIKIKNSSGGDVTVVNDTNLVGTGVPVFNFNNAYLYKSSVTSPAIIPDNYWIITLVDTYTSGFNNNIRVWGSIMDEGWLINNTNAFKYAFGHIYNQGPNVIGGYYTYGRASGIQSNQTYQTNVATDPLNKWVFYVAQVMRGNTTPKFKLEASGGPSTAYANGNLQVINDDANVPVNPNKDIAIGLFANSNGSGGNYTLASELPTVLYSNDRKIAYFGIFPNSTTEAHLDLKITEIKQSFGITW
jgi:hypothetical protein